MIMTMCSNRVSHIECGTEAAYETDAILVGVGQPYAM